MKFIVLLIRKELEHPGNLKSLYLRNLEEEEVIKLTF